MAQRQVLAHNHRQDRMRKSYLVCTLAFSAIRKGFSACCTRCKEFKSKRDRTSGKEISCLFFKTMTNCDVFVLDDYFGLMRLGMDACKTFLDIIDYRYENKTAIAHPSPQYQHGHSCFQTRLLAIPVWTQDRLPGKSYNHVAYPSLSSNDIILSCNHSIQSGQITVFERTSRSVYLT